MADDVKDDQVGSNSETTTSHQRKNSKKSNNEKTRLSKRIKIDNSHKQSYLTNNSVDTDTVGFQIDIESTETSGKNKVKPQFDKNKNIETDSKEIDAPGPSGLNKEERTEEELVEDSNSASGEDSKKQVATKSSSGTSNKRKKVSDSSSGLSLSAYAGKSKASFTKKSQKRKSREIPLYSPKRLRSATRLSRNSSLSDKTAKTGGRLSRLRNPPEAGEVSNTTGNLGSCASSRRQRRCRSRAESSTMDNDRLETSDNDNANEENSSILQSNPDGPSVVAVTSLAGSGGSSTCQDGDSSLGLEEGEMSRLQALLEARGLPAHLFGSLGPRMHLLLHKTFNTGAGTKAQQLILSMQNEEEGTQLQGVMEMCQLLVMGNEETLSGFPVKQVVPVLIKLLQMEHNFDMMNHACRALTYLMEALPRSSVVVIDAVPVLLEKLQTIQCMDVAEQSLTALAMLSKRHGKNIMQCGGLNASLLFLDFFSIVAQRSALAIAANCCHSVSSEEFHFVQDSIPILSNRLNNQDKKSLESVCLAFARLVDSVQKDTTALEEICQHGLLANLKQLLVITPPIISSGTFVMVIRMLAVMCGNCPSIAVKLVQLNIVETIRYLLIGGSTETLKSTDDIVELVPRSPQELFELVCLISELLPSLPSTGIFSIDSHLSKGGSNSYQSGTWQWRDDRNAWHTYLWVDNRIIEAAYQSGEDEISLSTLGRNYIIDFTSMQQINEDTGTIRAIQRKSVSGQTTSVPASKSNEKSEDERMVIFNSESKLGLQVVLSLIAVTYDVYYSSVGPAVKHKCLCSILKMLYHSPADLLKDVLQKIPISSYIAGMLSSQDLKIVCSALQKVDILMSKISDTFHSHFRREGVMHKIKGLADGEITVQSCSLTSPEKDADKDSEKMKSDTASAATKPSKSNDSLKTFDELEYYSEAAPDSSCGPSTSKLSGLKSKKRNVKKFSRQKSAKSSKEEIPSVTTSKRLSHDMLQPKSSTLTSTSTLESSSHKGSFFSNFAPRWGRSNSYQNTSPGSSIPLEKSLKERFVKEQEKNKENIRSWIKTTAQLFFDKYFADEAGFVHPALSILQKLTKAAESLFSTEGNEESALESIRDVFLNEDTDGGASPFEIVHSGIVNKLLKYLTFEVNKDLLRCSNHIKTFLSVFLGLKKTSDINAPELEPSPTSAFSPLIQKLNLCINQLEQFPVKCQDMPGTSVTGAGSRGSSALRFFNTHQIKCNLLRHPDCSNLKQWSGGAVKIDPLALVQAIERYLVVRGYGKIREGNDFETSDDDERSDDDIEESLATQIQGFNNPRHILEFVLNDHVLPYNMTVYEAIRQYAQGNYDENSEIDEDTGPYGRASIWSGTHTLYFRPVTETNENAQASSGLRRLKSDSLNKSLKKKLNSDDTSKEAETSHAYLTDQLPGTWGTHDPSVEVICLVRVLYYLNTLWESYFDVLPSRCVISSVEFINNKLTAKATRQLQDPLVIMTGNLPSWLANLANACPFIFPFECRQLLFYTTTFDRDRAMMKLQESMPDLITSDSSDRVMPRLDKKKRTVLRTEIFKQAEKVLNEFLNTKSLLEIQYEGEVGTGLGPTLEFYTLVSKEFQKADLSMWRGESIEIVEEEGDTQKKSKYTFSRDGLFPAAIPKNTKASQLAKIKSRFRFLGKFVGKACMDSRMADLPFSHTFYKWILTEGLNMNLSDLQYVDLTLYNSLTQLNDVVLQKKKIQHDDTLSSESLHLALNNLTLDGVPIEDLGLDFILPGTNIELKKNGKETPVTIDNLEEYLQSVVLYTLNEGVQKQFQAFKEGFENFFPVQSLEMFYPQEMELLLCGSKSEKWDIKELIECCRPDHGFTTDSRAVKFLFEILSKYDSNEQRMFLQFITGCPKLPVGGLKRLNPPLTIVRKTIEGTLNPDTYLPSVMTCVNYLKLPDYSSVDIMSERLRTAYLEGKNAFHLS